MLRVESGRLASVRDELARRGLDGFVVPRGDEHQGEFVAPCSERLRWLTGFSGSAGVAVLLKDQAALFVDGRYTLQAAREVDTSAVVCCNLEETTVYAWIASTLSSGAVLGYDPWLHTPMVVRSLEKACQQAGGRLVACDGNPLDAVWLDQPSPPLGLLEVYPDRFAGATGAEKRQQLAKSLCADKVDAVVLSAPDSIAWLLNIRGRDLPFTPLALSFAILHADASVWLFIDPRRVPDVESEHLGESVICAPPSAFGATLDALARLRVRIDLNSTPMWVMERLRVAGALVDRGVDPCALPKACKNAVELDGMRAAHQRDGVALTRFLAWLAINAPAGGITEMAAAARLEEVRRVGLHFRGLSFPTISAAGANAAIVHYQSEAATNRKLVPGELYLVDSGAQYLDGTTDVTRTVAITDASDLHRQRFTEVLKGHIAITRAVFPAGTTGSQLDVLARQALWASGVDYNHGTGHGVGSYLSVHEGPQRISTAGNSVALQPGMVLSIEPGYYKANDFGIRIENLVAVVPVAAPVGAELPLLGFETLTLAPIDRTLVNLAMLTAEECTWLDDYHRRVRESLSVALDPETAAWLAKVTALIREDARA